MVNEWTPVELYGANNDGGKRRFTIGDSTAASKGEILELADPRTAKTVTAAGVPIAGVASEEHLPDVGVTNISVWTDGIFEAVSSGAIVLGAGVQVGTVGNAVASFGQSAAVSGACMLGYCLETAADNETVNIRLKL